MKKLFSYLAIITIGLVVSVGAQRCRLNCHPPKCSCPRFSYPMDRQTIPQMVYFGFDDAVNVIMSSLYDRIFTEKRKNPNGCTIKMTLFVSHQYTDYRRVKAFYQNGHEIAVHSVTHSAIDTEEKLRIEARQQKLNIIRRAGVPADKIVGWRSPFLKPAGNSQPVVLKELGYEYDISFTYSRPHMDIPKPWPFTMDRGWAYRCGVRPCPTRARVPEFWAVPVVSLMDHKDQYPCSFVDGCAVQAQNEDEAFKYLMDNFLSYYNTTRTPFGLNMHAAWFYTRYNLKAMMRFLDELQKMDDVYVVTVKQMLEWMKYPTSLSDINTLDSWQCEESRRRQKEAMLPLPSVWEWDRMTGAEAWMEPVPKKQPKITTTTSPATTTTTRTTTTTTTTPRPTTTTTTPRPTTTTTTPRPTTTTPRPTTTTTTTTTTPRPTTTTTLRPTTTTTTPRPTTTPRLTTTTKPTTTTTQITPTTTVFRNPISRTLSTARAIHNRDGQSHSVASGASRLSSFTIDLFSTTTVPLTQGNAWWYMLLDPSIVELQKNSCQASNCRLPSCFCQGNKIPNTMKASETPQMVYLTIDGRVNRNVKDGYWNLIKNMTNPNGCPVRGTIFTSGRVTSPSVMKEVISLGAEIAMKGLHEHHFDTTEHLETELVAQMDDFTKNNISAGGWKTPELKALGNEQYRILKTYGLKYDATISENIPKVGTNKPWPYTLDFGYHGDCVIPECPSGKFPGLWELPTISVIDYRKYFECTYIDGCMFNPPTRKATENYLWENFLDNYKTNKAPLGLHLRQVWFTHPAYVENQKGLKDFIAKILTLKDVYMVSASDVITWMENPTKVQDITATVPWNCK